jgi:ParB family transcriptional regulator, chromosome partitioning protein
MSDRLCQINISDIDLTDERYKLSFLKKDITFLAQSIQEAGLVCAPMVRQLNNKFVIVSGFNRVRALIYNNRDYDNQVDNNQNKILVYEINADTTNEQCLLKSITAVSFQRQLTHFELILSAQRLSKFFEKEQMAEKSPAIFNTQLNAAFVADLLTIGALPDPALELIRLGNLSLKSAKRISLFERDTIKVFLDIFSSIRVSQNKQLEIILHLMEISKRDGIHPKDFFKQQEIQDILFDTQKEPGLKIGLFRDYLFKQRFPAIFKNRTMVKEKISAMKLGNKIKFLPPENFDSQTYSISFTAKNHKEFLSNVQTLNTALENKALKEILNP